MLKNKNPTGLLCHDFVPVGHLRWIAVQSWLFLVSKVSTVIFFNGNYYFAYQKHPPMLRNFKTPFSFFDITDV